MNPKFYSAAGILSMGCGFLPGCSSQEYQVPPRPNILIAIADDMSFIHAGAYGCTWVNTPAFDRVASEGILFNNAYTPNAKSSPSRACLLTGMYSWQLEDLANHYGYWPQGKFPSICETLGKNGYQVGFTGKGWAPGDPGKNEDGSVRRLTGKPYQKYKTPPPTKHISNNDYASNFEMFLKEQQGDTPWMFWYGGHEPHRYYEYGSGASLGGRSTADIDKVPGFWPDNDVVRNDMLDYAFEIEHFDMHLGRMLRMLEDTGQLSNTIIIVTADNGMPFPRAKGLQYEYSTHLPFAVMWHEGIKNGGRTEDGYVSFIDVVPTLLELAGIEGQENGMTPSGISLTDIMYDKPGRKREQVVLCQERHDHGRPANQGYPIRSIVRDGYMYLYNFKPELWPAGNPETGYSNTDSSPTKTEILNMRRNGTDRRYWDLSFGRHPQEELYHISWDRDCIVNLAGKAEYDDIRKRMKEALFAELNKYDDPRIKGDGDVFDAYPFLRENSNFYYEKLIGGEIKIEEAGWFYKSDFETGPVE